MIRNTKQFIKQQRTSHIIIMSHPIGWRSSEKREDAFEEIIVNSEKANLNDLRRIGWTGIPVSRECQIFYLSQKNAVCS